MTIKATLATIRALRMSASHREGEYRVTYPAHEMINAKRREETAYYTDDAQDAISTAQDMRRREDDRQNAIDEAVAKTYARRNSQGYSEREIYNATLAGIDEAMASDIAINYAANRAQALRNLTPAQESAIVLDVLRPDPDAARGFAFFAYPNIAELINAAEDL